MIILPRKRPVVFVLLVTLLMSSIGWTFNAAAVTHDFGHEWRVHGFTMSQVDESGLAQTSYSDDSAGIASHLSVHAAEHAQVFFLGTSVWVVISWVSDGFIPFVSASIPERVPGSLFRPPQNNFEI